MKGKLTLCTLVLICGLGMVAQAQSPPAGALVWFKADAGVEVDPNDNVTVTKWLDQSGNMNDATVVKGTMQLSSYAFSTGTLPVITFNNDGFMLLSDGSAFATATDISVYAVIDVEPAGNEWNRCEYFNVYSNAISWGYGFSLGTTPGRTIHYGTYTGTEAGYSDTWSGPVPGSDPMHTITVTISSTDQSKSVYYDGVLLSSTTIAQGMEYHPTVSACIGSLMGWDLFYLEGDLAELIVYEGVDAQQQADVEAYLFNKYGTTAPPQECGDWGYYAQDLNHDCYVNLADFGVFVSQWMSCTDPQGAGCVNLNP